MTVRWIAARLPWVHARLRLFAMQAVETDTERYVRIRDALGLMEEEHGPDVPIGEVIERLDDERVADLAEGRR